MKTLEIIEGLNRVFEEVSPECGYFIPKLSIEQSKISKLYKTYTLEVWHIKGTNKTRAIVIQTSARVPDNMDEQVIKDLNIKLSYMLFKDYEKIMEYGIQ
jgi:hypothetical protein